MTTYVSYSLIKISKTMSLVLQLQSAWALLRRPSCSTRRRLSTSSSGFQPRSSWECDTPPIQSWAWQYHWGQWSFLSRYSPSADRQCPDVNCRWNLVWRFVFKITLNISALVSSLRTASGLWCEVVDTLQRPSKDIILNLKLEECHWEKLKLDLFLKQSVAHRQRHAIFWENWISVV